MREINVSVEHEFVKGAGVPVGAAGSGKDVALKARFSSDWEGLLLEAQWRDARGGAPLNSFLSSPDSDGIYTVVVPFSAKKYAGKCSVTFKGYTLTGTATVTEGDERISVTVTDGATVKDYVEANVTSGTAVLIYVSSAWKLNGEGSAVELDEAGISVTGTANADDEITLSLIKDKAALSAYAEFEVLESAWRQDAPGVDVTEGESVRAAAHSELEAHNVANDAHNARFAAKVAKAGDTMTGKLTVEVEEGDQLELSNGSATGKVAFSTGSKALVLSGTDGENPCDVKIKGVADPLQDTDAANRRYADDQRDAAKEYADGELTDHNANGSGAHADIRQSVTDAVSTASNDATQKVGAHNAAGNAHTDIRQAVLSARSSAHAELEEHKDARTAHTKAQVGLENVDNTSDANKPVSTAQQEELDLKFDKAGGEISGALTINRGTGDMLVLKRSSSNTDTVKMYVYGNSTAYFGDGNNDDIALVGVKDPTNSNGVASKSYVDDGDSAAAADAASKVSAHDGANDAHPDIRAAIGAKLDALNGAATGLMTVENETVDGRLVVEDANGNGIILRGYTTSSKGFVFRVINDTDTRPLTDTSGTLIMSAKKTEAVFSVPVYMSSSISGNFGIALGGKRIINLAPPTSDADAANKKYIDDAVASKVANRGSSGNVIIYPSAVNTKVELSNVANGNTFIRIHCSPLGTPSSIEIKSGSGAIIHNSCRLSDVAEPTNPQDAATKKYVDDQRDAAKTYADGVGTSAQSAAASDAASKVSAHDAANDAHTSLFTAKLDKNDGTATGEFKIVSAAGYGVSIEGEGTALPKAQLKLRMGENGLPISFAEINASGIKMKGNATVTGLPTPTNDTDAANMAYVDDAIAALRQELGLGGNS